MQRFQTAYASDDFAQVRNRWIDVREEMRSLFHQSEKSVRSQRLHQSLHRAKIEHFGKVWLDGGAGVLCAVEIMFQQVAAFRDRERDVRVVEERRQIILRQSRPHSLKIDETGAALLDDDILALEIAMHEAARRRGKARRDFPQTP